jgi:CHAD domain-containing protein
MSSRVAANLIRSLPSGTLDGLLAALKRQWRRCRKGLKRCENHVSQKAVHAARVDVRRLLSLSELIAPFGATSRIEKLRSSLKRRLDLFEDLRDTHVLRGLLEELGVDYPAAVAFREHLRKREKRFARRTCREIGQAKNRRLTKLLAAARQDAAGWRTPALAEQANAIMLDAVSAAFQRTSALRKRMHPARPETIHCTRVAFKRFRYMIEALAGVVPIPEMHLRALHQYQTLLGDVQDLEVLLAAFDRYSRKRGLEKGAINAFRQELLRRQQRGIARCIDRADDLYKFWSEGESAVGRGRSRPGSGRSTPVTSPPVPDNSL